MTLGAQPWHRFADARQRFGMHVEHAGGLGAAVAVR
jgi:hypothetical protein